MYTHLQHISLSADLAGEPPGCHIARLESPGSCDHCLGPCGSLSRLLGLHVGVLIYRAELRDLSRRA